MNNKEFLDFIVRCEEKFAVSDWRFAGMHLWPLIRCCLFREVIKNQAINNNAPKNSLKSFLFKVKARLKHTLYAIKDWRQTAYPLGKHDVLFLGNGVTKSFFQEKWYDYLMEPLIEQHEKTGEKCLLLERGLYAKFPRNHKSILTKWIEEISGVCAIMAANFSFFKKKLASVDLILEELNHYVGSEVKFSHKILVRYILSTLCISYFFSLILAMTRPKKVYITCYYSITGLAMCFACAKRRIESVEVQHGNIFNNFAYLRWMQSPEESYNTLPKVFLFWSMRDEKLFLESNSEKILSQCRYEVHGIPWLSFWQLNNAIVVSYLDLLRKKSVNHRFFVLVTLRPDIFGNGEWDQLAELIRETKNEIFWFIRKHPTMTCSVDPSLKLICSLEQQNVDYELASKLPLYALLRFVELHITTASNVAVEASVFNVGTVFISNLAKLEMPHLIDGDMNQIITDAKQLQSVLFTKAANKLA